MNHAYFQYPPGWRQHRHTRPATSRYGWLAAAAALAFLAGCQASTDPMRGGPLIMTAGQARERRLDLSDAEGRRRGDQIQ